jgi:hypothetical protein
MRSLLTCLLGMLLLGSCRASLRDAMPSAAPAPSAARPAQPFAVETAAHGVARLGEGAAPGNTKGPGGFVPRGSRRNFYTAAGGRLWYYLNNYYWVPATLPREDLWIKAQVVEEIRELRRWPDGRAIAGPAPKVTVEYWEIGHKGRSVRLDSHKDFCLLSDEMSAGAITVEVTLTLGRLRVREKVRKKKDDAWIRPGEAYVLESRNYSGGGGIGADQARFEPLLTEAVTVWRYRIPWSSHPQRLTRSNWRSLKVPRWALAARKPHAQVPVLPPVVTPTAVGSAE